VLCNTPPLTVDSSAALVWCKLLQTKRDRQSPRYAWLSEDTLKGFPHILGPKALVCIRKFISQCWGPASTHTYLLVQLKALADHVLVATLEPGAAQHITARHGTTGTPQQDAGAKPGYAKPCHSLAELIATALFRQCPGTFTAQVDMPSMLSRKGKWHLMCAGHAAWCCRYTATVQGLLTSGAFHHEPQ
jgi:hypothetical protein